MSKKQMTRTATDIIQLAVEAKVKIQKKKVNKNSNFWDFRLFGTLIRYIHYFIETIVFVLDIPKQTFSKLSIIRHSICATFVHWQAQSAQIRGGYLRGKPGTTIFFRNHRVCFGEKTLVYRKRSSVIPRFSSNSREFQ